MKYGIKKSKLNKFYAQRSIRQQKYPHIDLPLGITCLVSKLEPKMMHLFRALYHIGSKTMYFYLIYLQKGTAVCPILIATLSNSLPLKRKIKFKHSLQYTKSIWNLAILTTSMFINNLKIHVSKLTYYV